MLRTEAGLVDIIALPMKHLLLETTSYFRVVSATITESLTMVVESGIASDGGCTVAGSFIFASDPLSVFPQALKASVMTIE